MATETEPAGEPVVEGDPVVEGNVRHWRPSRRPEHLIPHHERVERVHITERQRPNRPLAYLRAWLARPMVRVIIGISLLIAGAILFDATVNRGTWTQRQVEDRPIKQRVVPPG
jgi:hypothetical protein